MQITISALDALPNEQTKLLYILLTTVAITINDKRETSI